MEKREEKGRNHEESYVTGGKKWRLKRNNGSDIAKDMQFACIYIYIWTDSPHEHKNPKR